MLSLLLPLLAYAADKPTIVAIVDTGFGYNEASYSEKHLCKWGHKDFTGEGKYVNDSIYQTKDKVPKDSDGHGTHILGIIDKYAHSDNYCFVIIKIFHGPNNDTDMDIIVKAAKYLNSLKPDIVNYSEGGGAYYSEERDAIIQYINNGGIVSAAAGNYGQRLDYRTLMGGKFYPAMYDYRIHVVGNGVSENLRHVTSNYGELVKFWEPGSNMKSFGLMGTGTSQATALHTAKLLTKYRRHK